MKTLNLTHITINTVEEVESLPLIARFIAKHGQVAITITRFDGVVVEVVLGDATEAPAKEISPAVEKILNDWSEHWAKARAKAAAEACMNKIMKEMEIERSLLHNVDSMEEAMAIFFSTHKGFCIPDVLSASSYNRVRKGERDRFLEGRVSRMLSSERVLPLYVRGDYTVIFA